MCVCAVQFIKSRLTILAIKREAIVNIAHDFQPDLVLSSDTDITSVDSPFPAYVQYAMHNILQARNCDWVLDWMLP